MLIIALAFLLLSKGSMGAIFLVAFIMMPAILALISQIKSRSKYCRGSALIMNWILVLAVLFFVIFTIDRGQDPSEGLQGVVSTLIFLFFIIPFAFNIIYINQQKTGQKPHKKAPPQFYSAKIIDRNGVIERTYS